MKSPILSSRSILATLALTASLTLAASSLHAQATAEKQTAKTETAAKEGFNAADKKLIMAASESDETEISAAKLALQKSTNPKVKEYAEMMIKDHEKSAKMLKPIADAAGIPKPPLKPNHETMAAKLETLSGVEFDKAYLKGNVKAHTEILETMQKLTPEVSNAELKTFSATVTPIIEHHLMMAKEMEKAS